MGRFEYAVQQRQGENDLVVVGYFRSHTRKGLSLDSEDVAFLEALFREPYQVALLVRPYATKASTAGIFIREGSALNGDASYLEFPFRSSQLSSYRPSPLLAETPPASPPTAAPSATAGAPLPAAPKSAARAQIVPIASRREISLPAAPPAADPPAKETAAAPVPAPEPAAAEDKEREPEKAASAPATVESQKPEPKELEARAVEAKPAATAAPAIEEKSKKGMAIGIVAAIAVILVCLFVFPGFLRHGSIPISGQSGSSISLRVERTGTDILLTWNRDSDAIKNASHAVLYIFDGERHENYDMDLGQLRNGSIVYSPITADVSFRMDVARQGKNAVSESVRVLRTRPSPMGDDAQAQPATAAKPQTPAAPATAPTTAAKNGQPATPDGAEVAPPVEEPKPTAVTAATKPFDASSLVQRLRPATQNDLLEAPIITPGTGAPAVSNAISGLNLNSASTAPAAPSAPNAPDRKGPTVSGGQIKTAELIVRKEPEYPKLARQMGVKGVVELTATIGTDGKVKSVKVEKGHPLLTKAATDAVMQWVYRPTLLNGQPVQNDTKITLNFLGER
ncbi:MAG: TonB family protein [Candidatus Sulfopaludibacter sp.]|nr:TonB family protein [Candidatus Sulfopaludibacter sp.]